VFHESIPAADNRRGWRLGRFLETAFVGIALELGGGLVLLSAK